MKHLVISSLAVFFLMTAFSCSNSSKSNVAHDFELPELRSESRYGLDDFKGKAIVMNFWASWCAPCEEELPVLQQTMENNNNNNIKFIGINIMDNKQNAIKMTEKYGITYLNLHDSEGNVSQKYGVTALPVTVFIDPEGNIKRKKYGPFLGEEGEKQLQSYVKELMQ